MNSLIEDSATAPMQCRGNDSGFNLRLFVD